MSKKEKRYLGLGCVVAGGCFLFDPLVSVMDFLPDIVGYLLILHGLSCLADVDDRIAEAGRQFRKLALLAGVRLLTIPFIFGLTAVAEQGVELLLFSFCLAVLDLLVLLPAWRSLAAGLTSMATLHGGSVPLEAADGQKSRTDRFCTLTLIFMIGREVMSFLPELSVLSHQTGGGEAGQKWSHLYEFIGTLRALSAVIVLACGVVWLCGLCRYAAHLKRDDAFFEGVHRVYDERVTSNPGRLIKRRIDRALLLFGVAMILLTDFYADGINLLPDALAAVCLLAALLMLRPYAFYVKPCLAGAALLIPVNLAATVWQGSVLYDLASGGGDEFTMVQNAARLARDPEAYDGFYRMCLAVLASQLLVMLLLFGMYKVLSGVINRYTGLYVTHASGERMEALHTSMRRHLLLVMIFGMGCAAFSAAYVFTLPMALDTFMETFGVIDVALHLVFASLVFWEIHQIRDQMEYRFLLS